jgi:hypothetical protein
MLAAMFHDGGREALTQSGIVAGMALNREDHRVGRCGECACRSGPRVKLHISWGPGTNLAARQTFAIDWTCLLSLPHPVVKHSSLYEIHAEIQLDLIPTALLGFPRMHG